MPASFLGSCTRINKIMKRQLITRMKVKIPIIQLIRLIGLDAVFDDVGKAAQFQGRAADQGAVDVGLAH